MHAALYMMHDDVKNTFCMESTLWCSLTYKTALHVVFSLNLLDYCLITVKWLCVLLPSTQLHLMDPFNMCYKCASYLRWCYRASLNIRYLCGNLVSIILCSDDIRSQCLHWTHLLMFAGNMYRTDADNVNAILEGAHSLCIFRSVAFIRCNGEGVQLWMKNHSVDDEDDADYSSLLPSKPPLSRGISHHGDKDCITQNCKVSRLQAVASDWYHHLDYGLDQGLPNFLMSETSALIYIQPQAPAR